MGERILLWLQMALHPHERHTVLDRFVILWVLDLRPVRPLIRLQRIYNFLLLHAILSSILDIIWLYYTLLYYFWD